ncbi:MAG: hypothetical protein ACP5NV_04955 [Candidatus Woesearchaeota archaeon]
MPPLTSGAGKVAETVLEAELASKIEEKLQKSLDSNDKKSVNSNSEEKKNKEEMNKDKKEESLIDKQKKSLEESARNDRRAFARLDDLRQGPISSIGRFKDKSLIFVVILAIAAHIFDGLNSFQRPPSLTVIILYAIIIIWSFFFLSERKLSTDEMTLMFMIAIAILLPVGVLLVESLISAYVVKNIFGFMFVFPVLLIYFMFNMDGAPKKIARFYVGFWLIYGIIVILVYSWGQGAFYTDGISGPTIAESLPALGKGLTTTIDKFGSGVQRDWNMMFARATGTEYQSTEEEQRGIIIGSVTPVEQNYYTSSDIYVQAKISAKNLPGEVNVRTSCYVKDRGRGTTYPEAISMINNDENIIDCHINKLPKGNYQIFVSATFTYQTDADILYHFVEEKTRPELYASLNIPEKSLATYTGGPVMLGLPSLKQPLRISANGSNDGVGNYPFGVSLTNKWTEGKVSRGLNYALGVPEGIILHNCNRKIISESTNANDTRKTYVFSIDEGNVLETFDSVNCRMKVVDSGKLFNGDIVAQKTFNARAIYEYTIEESTYIQVAEDYASD